MRCRNCEDLQAPQVVVCSHCGAVHDGEALETAGNLEFLIDQIEAWQFEGLVPSRLAQNMIQYSRQELQSLELRILITSTAGAMAEPRPETTEKPAVAEDAVPLAPVYPPRSRPLYPPAAASAVPSLNSAKASAPSTGNASIPAGSQTWVRQAIAQQRASTTASLLPQGVPATAQPVDGRVRVAAPARPPRPPRQPFSWKQFGTLLLSERTLNALIGLGAFLILAAALAISLLPESVTQLGPLPHLLVMLSTAVAFYGAGAFVQFRLKLHRPGSALFAIGAAFVPLATIIFSHETLHPALELGAVWLLCSVISFPLYAASYYWLRDRSFALLSTGALGSLLLSAANSMGVTAPWLICALAIAACVLLAAAPHTQEKHGALGWVWFWFAQLTVPAVLAVLLGMILLPQNALSPLWSNFQIPHDQIATGVAWWIGVVFYMLAARILGERGYQAAAAYILPAALVLTLTKTPLDSTGFGLALALLSAAYVLFWQLVLRAGRPAGAVKLLQESLLQVALLLAGTSFVAVLSGNAAAEQIATLLILAAVSALLVQFLELRFPAYISVALVSAAYADLSVRQDLTHGSIALLAAAFSAALLLTAEAQLRLRHHDGCGFSQSLLDQGDLPPFVTPCLWVAYLAQGLALLASGSAALFEGHLSVLTSADHAAMLIVIALQVLVAWARRSATFFVVPILLFTAEILALINLKVPAPSLDNDILALVVVSTVLVAAALLRIRALPKDSAQSITDRAEHEPGWSVLLTASALLAIGLAMACVTLDRALILESFALGSAASAAALLITRQRQFEWPLIACALVAWIAAEALLVALLPVRQQPVAWIAAATLASSALLLASRARRTRVTQYIAVSIIAGADLIGLIALALLVDNHLALQTEALMLVVFCPQFLCAGGYFRRPLAALAGILPLVLAWELEAIALGATQPQLYALPIWLSLIATAELARRSQTWRSSCETLEAAALALLLGTTLVQAMSLGEAEVSRRVYEAGALLEGLLVLAAGYALRRKVARDFGAGAAVLAALIILAEPARWLAQLIYDSGQPQWVTAPLAALLLGSAHLLKRRERPQSEREGIQYAGLALLLGTFVWQAAGFSDAGISQFAYQTAVLLLSVASGGLCLLWRWRGGAVAAGLALAADAVIMLAAPLSHLATTMSGSGQPQYALAPLGLMLLVAAFTARLHGASQSQSAALEMIAVLSLLGVTFLQSLGQFDNGGDRMGYVSLLGAEGALLWIAAAILHWKRTFFAANAAVVVATLLWLAWLVESLQGRLFQYLLIFAAGCVLIVVATFLERSRERIPLWIDQVRIRLESWS